VLGPTGIRHFFPRALLDPGSDDTIFSVDTATLLGVTMLTDSGHAVRWRGQRFSLRFGNVDLEITDSLQILTWNAVVGFSPAPIRYPLLGLAGCLQFFDARFRGHSQLVEMEPNSAFGGAVIP
jgi:hypothetical protein